MLRDSTTSLDLFDLMMRGSKKAKSHMILYVDLSEFIEEVEFARGADDLHAKLKAINEDGTCSVIEVYDLNKDFLSQIISEQSIT